MRNALPGFNLGLGLGVKTRFLSLIKRSVENGFRVSFGHAPTIAQAGAECSGGRVAERRATG